MSSKTDFSAFKKQTKEGIFSGSGSEITKKKGGRPVKQERDRRSYHISVYVTDSERDKLQNLLNSELEIAEISLGTFVRGLLKKHEYI